MPGLNGTGPLGQGSKTGGGFGKCNGNSKALMSRRRGSQGCVRGRAFGNGFQFMQDSKVIINEDSVNVLRKQQEAIEKRISYLGNGANAGK
jgi:hypothetical protein